MAHQQTNQPNLYSNRFKFGQKQEELDTLRQENEYLKLLYHKSREEIQESKSEFQDFKQRMGKIVDLTLGSSEDISNPCRESELKNMYKKLSQNEWAKFLLQLKKGVPELTAGQPKELRKQAEQKIKAVLLQSQEDIENIMISMKRFITSRQEQPENTMPAKHFDLAIKEFQMAVYQKKNGCYNTDELQDIPDVLHPMIEECYKISCLMTLQNPPLLLDYDNCGKGPFPPIKSDVIRKTEPFSSPVDLHSNQPPLENLDPPEGSQDQNMEKSESALVVSPDWEKSNSCFCQPPLEINRPERSQECSFTAAEMADSRVFIAVDFGTAFSGYCFKIKGSTQIRQPVWGEEHSIRTCKTPTSILFDENEKFLKFGYDAVITYSKQIRGRWAKKLYLFDNFKMELFGKELHRDIMLTARNGKQMRAMKVFSESLRFMKDHALETIGKHTAGVKYSASDATWILTVPAIWSAAAKQFMREAATEAGLVTESEPDRLIIALEPEAASVWCRQLPSEGFVERDLRGSERIHEVPGTQYMVVDCGGGTIDITVHEVVEDGRLKELHKVSGRDMGGQTVDKNFKKFLRELFSEKVFDEFEKNHPNELQRLMYDFSNCKGHDGEVCLVCPSTLKDLAYKERRKLSSKTNTDWKDEIIHVSKEKLRSLHDDSLRSIESLIENILKKRNLNIDYLFLVGGFALSPYVNSFIREKFGGQCKVVCPVDPQMAVLKGAVTFGMIPNVVESRISRFTYGIGIAEVFDETKHRGKRKHVTKEGIVYCDVCFHCLVKKGESVLFDEVREFDFRPVEKDQKSVRFSFCYTESKTLEFIDEPGMVNFGYLTVSLPVNREGSPRLITLKVKFGFTEIQVSATDNDSGETSSVTLDFMAK